MKCENCGKETNERFCSKSCAKSFSTKNDNKQETKEVICTKCSTVHNINKRASGNNYICNKCNGYIENCKYCGNKKNNIKKDYCSVSCARKDNPHHITDDGKKKLSEIAKNKGLGGVTQSRWIRYNGKTLGSSYELEVVKDLDKHNIKWDTCKKFKYKDNKGKDRTYTPDIYLIDYKVYLDPKNDYLIENVNPNLGFKDTDKIQWVQEQNNIKILVLNKNQLTWDYISASIAQG